MKEFHRTNYSGVVLCRIDREDLRGPVDVREHTLLYVSSGRVDVVQQGDRLRLSAGDCVFLRRDHRVHLQEWSPADGEPFRSVALFFCRHFLLEYYRTLRRGEIPRDAVREDRSVWKIPPGPDIESLFLSLSPYLDSGSTLPAATAFAKRREGLLCLLGRDRNLWASLFDFTQPWKVDLLSFMEDNYTFDLTLPELARYSGRSLSSFKRDFARVSDLTPGRWVVRRRLQDAHALLSRGDCTVAEAMGECGFKDPAVFSRAYRRLWGYPPSRTPRG